MILTDEKSKKIQILRGIAICAVVIIHNTPAGLAQVFCRPFLNFAVGLFLFLSGLLSDVNHWRPYKRIIKVMIPYIIWSLIYTILYNVNTPSRIPVSYLKNMVTGSAAAVMYYIFVYIEFALLVPLIDKLANSKYKYWGFILSPIEVISMRLLPLILEIEINKSISIIMDLSCIGWFSYFYLGYLLGNNIMFVNFRLKKIFCLYVVSIVLQIVEGYWFLSIGEMNCGTQLKLSSLLTGMLFVVLGYRFINSTKAVRSKYLYTLGNHSFGIFFSHLAIMVVLRQIPIYAKFALYSINAVIVIIVDYFCIVLGKRLLKKYGKYLAI